MSKDGNLNFLFQAGIIAGSGGLIFGYDVGIISGAMFQISDKFNLSNVQEGLVVSLLSVGSIFGCFLGGFLSDYLGRWRTIQIQNLIFGVGFIILAFANSITSLYVGRFILGVASAFSAVADVPYLNEIAPVAYRGRLSSIYEVMIVFGAFLSSICSLLLWQTPDGWRYMFIIPLGFALAQSLGLMTLPESPKWLMQKNRVEEAQLALQRIYGADNGAAVEKAVEELKSSMKVDSCANTRNLSSSSSASIDTHMISTTTTSPSSPSNSNGPVSTTNSTTTTSSTWGVKEDVLSEAWRYRLPFFIIIVLMALGQLTGSVVIRNYAPSIFSKAGIDRFHSLELNTFISTINLVIVTAASSLVDRFGRRALLCAGFATAGLGMFSLGTGFAVSSANNVAVFFIGAVLTSAGFNMGFGPVGWILSSELFPTDIRGRALSLSTIMRNVFEFLTNFLFLISLDKLGAPGTFFLFMFFCILSLVFTLVCLVETSGLDPGVILLELTRRPCWQAASTVCGNSSEEERAVLMKSYPGSLEGGGDGDDEGGVSDSDGPKLVGTNRL